MSSDNMYLLRKKTPSNNAEIYIAADLGGVYDFLTQQFANAYDLSERLLITECVVLDLVNTEHLVWLRVDGTEIEGPPTKLKWKSLSSKVRIKITESLEEI